MALYTTKRFERLCRKIELDRLGLRSIAEEVIAGRFEADLGGGVIKKRVALSKGKSGGARAVLFFRQDSNLFFYDVWLKSDVSGKGMREIEEDELEAYKLMARRYLSWNQKEIEKLIAAGMLHEV